MKLIAPWADLPRLPLEMILDRLAIPDHVRFASVCTAWRDAARDHRPHHAASPHRVPQMPWLMISQDSRHTEGWEFCTEIWDFYSLSESRHYRLPLPAKVQGKKCCGASHGWLMFLKDFMLRYITSLILVNPLAPGSEIEIPMPDSIRPIERPFAALSTVPTDPDCFVLLSTKFQHLFRRVRGDQYWIPLQPIPEPYGFVPAVCEGKFYITSEPSDGSKLAVVGPFPSRQVSYQELGVVGMPMSPQHQDYLVESDGQILMVRVTNKPHCGLVERFEVFKADLPRKLWVRMESLGDRVLFLSNYQHYSLSAAETGGPGNYIYFTSHMMNDYDYNLNSIWIEYDYGSHQIVNTQLPHLMKGETSFYKNILLWVVPSLC